MPIFYQSGNLVSFVRGSGITFYKVAKEIIEYGFAEYGYSGGYLQDLDRYTNSTDTWVSRTDGPAPARYLLAGFSLQ